VDLTAKFQLKPGNQIEGVSVPQSVSAELTALVTGPLHAKELGVLVFVVDRSALDQHRSRIVAAASEDRLTWVAYPKAGQLGTDLNRDSLAADLGENRIRPVRQIAIDDVWSALRFRPS